MYLVERKDAGLAPRPLTVALPLPFIASDKSQRAKVVLIVEMKGLTALKLELEGVTHQLPLAGRLLCRCETKIGLP